MKHKEEFEMYVNKLIELVSKIDPKKQHVVNKKLVPTRERALQLLRDILKLDIDKDKIKIQEKLASLDGTFGLLGLTPHDEELKNLYKLFEIVCDAWVKFNILFYKISSKLKVEKEEFLNVAKEMLNAMLKGEVSVDLGSASLSGLIFLLEDYSKADEDVEHIFYEIDGYTWGVDKKTIKKHLENINELLEKTKEKR